MRGDWIHSSSFHKGQSCLIRVNGLTKIVSRNLDQTNLILVHHHHDIIYTSKIKTLKPSSS